MDHRAKTRREASKAAAPVEKDDPREAGARRVAVHMRRVRSRSVRQTSKHLAGAAPMTMASKSMVPQRCAQFKKKKKKKKGAIRACQKKKFFF